MHALSYLLQLRAAYPMSPVLFVLFLLGVGTVFCHPTPSWSRRARVAHGVAIFLVFTALFGCGELVSSCKEAMDSVPFLVRAQKAREMSRRLLGVADAASGTLSTTPRLQFQGNLTTVVPAVGGSGDFYSVGLERQANCTLTEYLLSLSVNSTTLTASVESNVPNYQNTLHALAGLTTTPNRWPNGCKSPVGITSSAGVYVGPSKDGSLLIGAGIDSSSSAAYNNANVFFTGTVNPATGTPTLSAVTSIPDPSSVATADLNGDGNNDLVITDYANSSNGDKGGVYIMLGNGDGTFQAPVLYAAGTAPTAVAIDDVNNDGKLDLVVASNQVGLTTGIAVLLGKGDGTFQAAVTSPSAGGSYVATGDFNGDGNKDIVLANGAIQLGKGDGTFAASTFTLPLPVDAGTLTAPGAPAVGDFNNDGKLDIALNVPAGNINGPFVSIFPGKGDGTFTAGASYAGIYGTTNLATADLDGDGNLDLVAGIADLGMFGPDLNSSGLIQVLMGNGDGTFQAAPAFPNTALGTYNVAPAFAAGDFNGDGKPDILAALAQNTGVLTSSGMVLLTGDGKGNFTAGSPITGNAPSIFAAADMNGDSKLDAVVADGPSHVGIALGNGNGTFQAMKDYPVPNSETVMNIALGDFNGDGKPDVLVAAVDSTGAHQNAVYLYLNSGDGTLGTANEIGTAVTPWGLAVADFNGDGKLDFVLSDNGSNNGTTNPEGALLVFLGNGSGAFAAPVSYSPGYFPGAVAIADMNNDGKPDVIVASVDQSDSTGTLSIYLGNGDGTLETPTNVALPDTFASNLAVADFDGDGNADVAIGDCCGNTLSSVYFGKGDGTIASQYALAVGISSQSLTAVDVNGDKRPDLLLTSGPLGGTSIEVLLNLYGQVTTTPGLTATTTTLAVSPNPATAGQAVTFSAQVSPASGTGTPTGTVNFMNGTTQLGSGTLNASGQATYSTSTLAAGTYSLTAAYGGDSNYSGSTSSAVSLSVAVPAAPASFTVSANPTTLSVTPGQSGSTTLKVTPTNGFNQAVSFSCSGLPSEATCSFSPASDTLNGTAAATTSLTIATTAPTSSFLLWPLAGGGLTAACALFFFRRGNRVSSLICLLLLAGVAGIAAGCGGSGPSSSSNGGGSSGNSGTPAGTSAVMVTATSGSGATALSQSITVSLTVQ